MPWRVLWPCWVEEPLEERKKASMQSKAVQAGASDLNGQERERVIRKIKRCLALGESSNANEAEMALRQAQNMMRAYRLSEADIHAEAVDCNIRETGLKRMSDWQRSLANAAASAFGCKLLIRHVPGWPFSFEFVGVMPAAELAAYAYDSLLMQVKKARKQFQAERLASRRAADEFCVAWVHAVSLQVRQFARDNPVSSTQSNALVLVEQQESAAIDAWIQNRYGEVGKSKQNKRDFSSAAAVQAGLLAGAKAQLHQAVHSRDGQWLLAGA